MKALVTGGTGFLGTHLVTELLHDDWTVRVLARRVGRATRLPEGVEVVIGDLDDNGVLGEAARGADVVFHLAAATSGPWEAHAATTVEGTRRMLEACHDAGVRRFILASSIVVYDKSGRVPGEVIRESSELLEAAPAAGAYARGKLEAERLARQYMLGAAGGSKGNRSAASPADAGRMEVVIVRPGLVYGPGRLAFPHLGELFGETRVAYGSPSLLLPLVEACSCARALVHLATSTAAGGRTYNVIDAHSTTRDEYLRAIESVTGHRPRTLYLPARPVAFACGMLGRIGRAAGVTRMAELSQDKIRARSIELRYDTSALQADTSWRPLQSFEHGLARTLELPAVGPRRSIERVGIVGAGAMARAHAAALRRVPGVRIVGILDTDLAAAESLATSAGGAPAFDDSRQFYGRARPDLVH
ncbi:MAG: NAD(P)-dependent oxidoreductase, partial [Lysobacterales bacterium]